MMLANPYNAMILSEEEVMKLLHKGLVLDGSAARILVQRGFGKFLGVEENFEPQQPPSTEEVLDIADMEDLAGLNLYNFLAWPAGSEGGAYFTYKPLRGSEVITNYRGHENLPAQPGIVRYENELGGRIVIMPLNLPSMSSNLFCHRKQKLMRKLIQLVRSNSIDCRNRRFAEYLSVRLHRCRTEKSVVMCDEFVTGSANVFHHRSGT